MSTNIDSLQIEIVSSSAGAVRSIKDLASALGELKSNSKITSAVNNLNNLRKALHSFANIPSNASKVLSLAGSLEKLKNVGSVASIGNSLTKLAGSLKSLDTVKVNKEKIESIANALGSLSAVKAGGINTMMNGLAKMGKVTASLDDDAIDAFAERIEKLTQKLRPLSEKMTTIQAGLKGINSTARSAGSSVKKMGDDVDGASVNFASFIYSIQEVVQWLQQAIQKFSAFMSDAIEWDGIAARFGRGFAGQAKETYDWIQRLNEEMGINIQQFMKYSSVYATMLTGFGVANEDATKMALGYTELTYDIWAGYNDIYKNFDDAAEAVKSAIAGEVEPIRRAGFTIIESTLEQTAANHGLEISLANATEAQKSYLRYLTLVDQAHSQGLVGTYAKELQTAEGLMRTFSQQLKSLTQAFGSLFLPILVKIMPYMQAFVELLTEAVHWVASLFGVTIQKVDWSGYEDGAGAVGGVTDAATGATDALGSAAEAAKELKNATIGIDELNVISPPSSSGGSGGSGAGGAGGNGFEDLGIDSLWDESIFAEIGNQVDKIKEKLKSWLPVIEAVAGIFGALGIGLLLAQLGEGMEAIGKMEGLVGTLKKTLAGLAILTIEAVLVFMFADNYLETGNLLPLLGEAIATAAGGYLMYKGFGTKGLVLSLAVSMAMQLAAITMNLADGGVEIDDPQLWIQAAMTTLTGAAGGLYLFKGVAKVGAGKGAVLGATLGMSLSLAAITIGEVAANGEVTKASIFTGVSSVLSAAGFGFTVGGPWGAVIGAAVGLGVNIIGAAIASVSAKAEKDMKDELENRFGRIELDMETLAFYVDKITAIPREVTIDANVWNEELEKFEVQEMTVSVDVAIDIFKEENKALQAIRDQVTTLEKKLDSQNIKIALGMEVSFEDYAATIDNYVATAREYLDQYYLTTNIALSITGADTDGSLAASLDAFYLENTAKLTDLGSKLKDAVSDAFVDGEWIPEKLEEARKLQQEIQEILNYVSEVEYRAKMQNLTLEVTGDKLTPDSFKGVLEGAQAAIEEKLATLEEVKMSQLKVAIMEYDANIEAGMSEAEAKKIYDKTVEDIEREYQNGRLEVQYGTVDFGLETLHTAFAEEIARAKAEGWFNYEEKVNYVLNDVGLIVDKVAVDDGEIYTGLLEMIRNVGDIYKSETEKLSPEVRKNLESLLEKMKPTMSDYEKIAEECRKAGKAVPEEVRNGINDYNALAALAGDAKGINYMLGQQFSTDPVFINTLATMENAGEHIDKSIAEGLLNNLEIVENAADGTVTILSDGIEVGTYEATPTLVANMEALGMNLSDGLLAGAESEMSTNKKSWLDWAIWPWNWFKEKNEINSPSKLFERGGGFLIQGLLNGVGNNPLGEKLSDVWGKAKSWWDNSKETLKTYTPSIGSIKDKLSAAWTSAKDWWNKSKTALATYTPSIGKIWEKLKSAWTSAKDWWNKNRSNLSYTPSIGSIKTKLSSAWTSAKDWWNKNRSSLSYTPSIGSIKDKVVSAWNSAKSWWNSNAKLSTKLNIQTPKLTVNWGEVSALGKTFKYPKSFSLKFAADGGVFDQGSLVWAGERGPEILANAGGGRTGVMNVQQMQDAVYEGVYAAVVAAMSATGGNNNSQPVNVYLDGKQITATVERRQRERGASILGNQVYAY